MLNNIKFKGESGLFMIPIENNKSNIDIKVGDLYLVKDRLCLVLDLFESEDRWRKRVLIRWADAENVYWINHSIFCDMIREINNENR